MTDIHTIQIIQNTHKYRSLSLPYACTTSSSTYNLALHTENRTSPPGAQKGDPGAQKCDPKAHICAPPSSSLLPGHIFVTPGQVNVPLSNLKNLKIILL